ncbi:MAG: hypothetical protein U0835_04685 [Isosphaeraceae bacterium]
MTRRVVDLLNAMPERPAVRAGLRAWVGLRQTGLAIDRGARHSGRPKFTPAKLAAARPSTASSASATRRSAGRPCWGGWSLC